MSPDDEGIVAKKGKTEICIPPTLVNQPKEHDNNKQADDQDNTTAAHDKGNINKYKSNSRTLRIINWYGLLRIIGLLGTQHSNKNPSKSVIIRLNL